MWSVEIEKSAKKELDALPNDLRIELLHAFETLARNGPFELPHGLARKIDGKFWELRVRDKSGIARAMYFTIHPQRAIILTAFVKKSQKLPAREHEKAEARMKSFQMEDAVLAKRLIQR